MSFGLPLALYICLSSLLSTPLRIFAAVHGCVQAYSGLASHCVRLRVVHGMHVCVSVQQVFLLVGIYKITFI